MYVHKKDENQNVFTISDYNTFGGNHYYEKKLFLCSGEKNDVFWNVLQKLKYHVFLYKKFCIFHFFKMTYYS